MAQAPEPETPGTAGNAMIEEIVVTARRREENLLDVTLAVTALGGEELAQLCAINLIYLSQAPSPLGLDGNTTTYYGNPRQFWLDLQYRFK